MTLLEAHVPEERFDGFWRLVRSTLRPGGRAFLLDSGGVDPAQRDPGRDERQERRPDALAERVRGLGFELELRTTANGLFLVGGGA